MLFVMLASIEFMLNSFFIRYRNRMKAKNNGSKLQNLNKQGNNTAHKIRYNLLMQTRLQNILEN